VVVVAEAVMRVVEASVGGAWASAEVTVAKSSGRADEVTDAEAGASSTAHAATAGAGAMSTAHAATTAEAAAMSATAMSAAATASGLRIAQH
jgi:hypothetical protein